MTQSLMVATEELLSYRQLAATSIPDPCQEAQHLLSRLKSVDDVEAYILDFKHVAHRERWTEEDWIRILAPLLLWEVQVAYDALTPAEAED